MTIRGQQGFTLVEVMLASVILAILVLGLSSLWSVVGGQVTDLTLRQKAVFVLNGQMERLTALYQFTDFGGSTAADTSGYGAPAAYPDARAIFRDNVVDFMPTPGDGFVVDPAAFAGAAGSPVALVPGGSTSSDRNFVWLDRDRDVVARLSWTESDLVIDRCDNDGEYAFLGNNSCYCLDFEAGGNQERCREIMLILEFPFRWNQGTVQQIGDALHAMPLKTIVGRWL